MENTKEIRNAANDMIATAQHMLLYATQLDRGEIAPDIQKELNGAISRRMVRLTASVKFALKAVDHEVHGSRTTCFK